MLEFAILWRMLHVVLTWRTLVLVEPISQITAFKPCEVGFGILDS